MNSRECDRDITSDECLKWLLGKYLNSTISCDFRPSKELEASCVRNDAEIKKYRNAENPEQNIIRGTRYIKNFLNQSEQGVSGFREFEGNQNGWIKISYSPKSSKVNGANMLIERVDNPQDESYRNSVMKYLASIANTARDAVIRSESPLSRFIIAPVRFIRIKCKTYDNMTIDTYIRDYYRQYKHCMNIVDSVKVLSNCKVKNICSGYKDDHINNSAEVIVFDAQADSDSLRQRYSNSHNGDYSYKNRGHYDICIPSYTSEVVNTKEMHLRFYLNENCGNDKNCMPAQDVVYIGPPLSQVLDDNQPALQELKSSRFSSDMKIPRRRRDARTITTPRTSTSNSAKHRLSAKHRRNYTGSLVHNVDIFDFNSNISTVSPYYNASGLISDNGLSDISPYQRLGAIMSVSSLLGLLLLLGIYCFHKCKSRKSDKHSRARELREIPVDQCLHGIQHAETDMSMFHQDNSHNITMHSILSDVESLSEIHKFHDRRGFQVVESLCEDEQDKDDCCSVVTICSDHIPKMPLLNTMKYHTHDSRSCHDSGLQVYALPNKKPGFESRRCNTPVSIIGSATVSSAESCNTSINHALCEECFEEKDSCRHYGMI